MDGDHPLARKQPGVSVGVAAAEGRHPHRAFGGEGTAVADRLAGQQLLYMADHGFQLHNRRQLREANLAAGVFTIQDDAGPHQIHAPIRVKHQPGRVAAVNRGEGVNLPNLLHSTAEQIVLVVGKGNVVRLVRIRRGEMLEHSGDLQPGQIATGAQAMHTTLKIGTQIKPDAPHAGVGF